MLERGKVVPAISREMGISQSKIYEIRRGLGTLASQKSPQEVARGWWENLPNRAESVLAVATYIHQIEAATGMAALDRRLHYGLAEQMVIDSISAHDVEVASAAKGYAEMTEEVSTKATGEDGWIKTMPTGHGWVRTVEGMVSKQVRAKARELIEALRSYSTL